MSIYELKVKKKFCFGEPKLSIDLGWSLVVQFACSDEPQQIRNYIEVPPAIKADHRDMVPKI